MSSLDVDPDKIDIWIKGHFPELEGTPQVERAAGGQSNPTYIFTYGDQKFVLRRRPDGELLPSAHAIEREFRVQCALIMSDIYVPTMFHYCEDESVARTEFYLMEFIPGRVFRDSSLSQVDPELRKEMYFEMAKTLALIHSVDIDEIGLTDFGPHGNYFARQIRRWTQQWQLSKNNEDPALEHLIAWLPKNLPATDMTTLVHGDYRIGNLIFDPHESFIVSVIDWELSTLGHPLADLANSCCYAWFLNSDEYGQGIGDLQLEELNLPTLEEFVAAYHSESPHGIRLSRFHLVFALFRMAVIFAGVATRAQKGNAASDDALNLGIIAPRLAQRGAELSEQADFEI